MISESDSEDEIELSPETEELLNTTENGVDPAEFGKRHWPYAFNYITHYPVENATNDDQLAALEFLERFMSELPCADCGEDMQLYLQRHHPKLQNRCSFFKWLWKFRNCVNRKLGQKELSLDEAIRVHCSPSNSNLKSDLSISPITWLLIGVLIGSTLYAVYCASQEKAKKNKPLTE